ncbi:Pr6Pr family membrane protein [Aurantiacibacter sp. D1-12]|uniref:Pr6Pr family membrane protein n=1 Tax=Aurantiacibacter sp. D1-12 TaxID=2993658 RepID=UPI00237C8FA1|nr:Pr6Pr family membrane protein [Aurantiacibacter sp. D1-12]MDE1467214.1 Pr6Pr family membrane protein [Aurantiacibacter sp. D1-12]
MDREVSPSRNQRLCAALIALIALGSITLQFTLRTMDGQEWSEASWGMAQYFTILTNLLVGLSFALIASGRKLGTAYLLALTSAILGVGLVYHIALAHLNNPVGLGIWADHGVHTAAPALTMIWFLAFTPEDELDWRHVPLAMVWPVAYTAYALPRGMWEGTYPYFFLDANELGIVEIIVNLIGLSLFFISLAAFLVFAVRLRGGRLSPG